jgi:hypothetical protein
MSKTQDSALQSESRTNHEQAITAAWVDLHTLTERAHDGKWRYFDTIRALRALSQNQLEDTIQVTRLPSH